MENDALDVRLVGSESDDGQVSLFAFGSLCETIERCLHATEKSFGLNRSRYRIVRLEMGSAALSIAPFDAYSSGRSAIRLFEEAIETLENRSVVDPNLSIGALRQYRQLALPVIKHNSRLWIGSREITSQLAASIDQYLSPPKEYEGSVKGRLEQVNIHDGFKFMIYPPTGNTPVLCLFEDEMLDDIKAALSKSVTVRGMLHLRPGAMVPHKVNVKRISVFNGNAPTIFSLKGILPDATNGVEPVEFVRALRDG